MAAGRTSFACMKGLRHGRALSDPRRERSLVGRNRSGGRSRERRQARAAGNRGRAAGVREAREGHSLAVVRRVRDEWRAGRRSDVLAVVARSHASARKQTHRREGTYIPYLYGQTVTTVIVIWRAIRKRHLLSHQMALLAVSRSLSFEPARRLCVSGGTRLVRRPCRAGPLPRAGRGAAGRHGRVSPRRVFCEVRLRGARGARARVDRVGAAPESDERSLRVESAGGGGRGVGDARPGSSARGRAVGHGHAASARQRDAPARARRARDARRRAGRVSSVFEARCGCASRRLGLCRRGGRAGGDVRLFFGAIAVSGRGGRRETERPRGDETSRVADGGVFGVFVPSPRRRGRRARDERRVERAPPRARTRRGGASDRGRACATAWCASS